MTEVQSFAHRLRTATAATGAVAGVSLGFWRLFDGFSVCLVRFLDLEAVCLVCFMMFCV